MITVSVAHLHGLEVYGTKFLRNASRARLKIDLEDPNGGQEEFAIPVRRRFKAVSQLQRTSGLVTAVITHQHPHRTERLALKGGQILHEEETEEITDLTRIWLGYKHYMLFWFRGKFPGRGYPKHRLLVARCFGQKVQDESQNLVEPYKRDLAYARGLFPHGIWAQNFRRGDPIHTGRILGEMMEQDPLYDPEFSDIISYIGLTIPTVGSEQKVKVLADGRLQFMSWQAEHLDDPHAAGEILDKILEVLDLLERPKR